MDLAETLTLKCIDNLNYKKDIVTSFIISTECNSISNFMKPSNCLFMIRNDNGIHYQFLAIKVKVKLTHNEI